MSLPSNLTSKKRILILCDWFLPGYLAGGPIQSVAALTHHLRDEFDFRIITADTDFKATEPYRSVKADMWTTYAGRDVYYISRANLTKDNVAKLINDTPHDILYLNSMFSKFFAVIPLQLKKKGLIHSRIVLAPRGMLSDGALKTKSLKKKLFLSVAKAIGLFKGLTWQSTSPQETQEIRKRIGDVLIKEASNLPNIPMYQHGIEKQAGALKLCYVARICETKNLAFAIEVLRSGIEGRVALDVYGPIEDPAYWEQCQASAKQLPSNIHFSYKSPLHPQDVSKAICDHHALFLPTHNENFGHAMVEAMLCARPIVISDQTPWRQLKQERAGFDIDLSTPEKFRSAINELTRLDNIAFQDWSQHARAYIHQRLSIQQICEAYRQLFS